MAITESSRHNLHQRLAEVLGSTEATTLMEHLPPIGWADVATKRDLDHLESSLRHEFNAGFSTLDAKLDRHVTRLDGQIDRLDGKIDSLGERLDNKSGAIVLRMNSQFDLLRAEFKQELAEGLHNQFMRLLVAMITLLSIATAVGHFL